MKEAIAAALVLLAWLATAATVVLAASPDYPPDHDVWAVDAGVGACFAPNGVLIP